MEATSDTGVPTNKRERKANFSDEEVSSLLEEFGENASVLQNRLTNSVTNKRKKPIWEAICAKVNSFDVLGVDTALVEGIVGKYD